MKRKRLVEVWGAGVAVVAVALLPACSNDKGAKKPGSGGTSSPRPSPSGAASPTAALPPVELRPDGLGIVRLGASPEEVLDALTARWGPPDLDTGWHEGISSRYGVCPGMARGVEWNTLAVLFSDGDTQIGPEGKRHFFSWIYRAADPGKPQQGEPTRLQTPDGLTAGSTVADLKRVYGSRLNVVDEDAFGPLFSLDPPPEHDLSGFLSSVEGSGTVEVLAGGPGRGE